MGYIDFTHGGNIYEAKRKYKREIIDFSANINPLDLPARVKRAICKNFNRILHYPDSEAKDIRGKIAKYWGIDEQNVLVGNGSIELIYLIMFTYKPRTTLIPVPTFSEYERAASTLNCKIRFLKLEEKEGFRFSVSGYDKSDVVFLCNPNNPTGNLILEDREESERLANRLVVVDEAFMDFLPNQRNYTLIWKAINCKKIAVLRTFTKFFAIPGLRMGYIIAHKEIINRLKQHQPPWSTNSLAQLAAELVLNDKEYINKTYKFIEKERQFLFKQLAKIDGLRPYPSATNFLLLRIEKTDITSKSLRELLIKKGILVRDCANFRNLNDKYIRVAVRSHKENLGLLTGLKEVL